nr:AarF/UbiB family protein [Polyangium spumosum]
MRLGRPGTKSTPLYLGQLVRGELERLGGLWIKVGQRVATHRSAFSNAFCEELCQIHDWAFAFHADAVVRIIEQELARPVKEAFREFDVVPIAVTSIGQVHVAWLVDRDVKIAVKVQRPGVDAAFTRDAALIEAALRFCRCFRIVTRAQASDIHSMLVSTLEGELDYRVEAAAIRATRRALPTRRAYVPKVFSRYCSRRVLVMEFVDGVLLSDYARTSALDPKRAKRWRKENRVHLKKLCRRLTQGEIAPLLRGQASRGKLVPGEIMLLRKNRIALLDFGAIGALDKGLTPVSQARRPFSIERRPP